MPLIKRQIQPNSLAKKSLPPAKNGLETLTNSVIAGTLAQLASLSDFSQDIFEELGEEAKEMGIRIETLKERTAEINDKVDRATARINFDDDQLLGQNSSQYPYQYKKTNKKGKNLASLTLNTAVRNSVAEGMSVLDRSTLPTVLKTYYETECASPPPIHILDSCREPTDKVQESMKVYTDPDFFFNLWREKIQHENRQKLQKRRKKRNRDTSKMNRENAMKNEISKPASMSQTWKNKASCMTESHASSSNNNNNNYGATTTDSGIGSIENGHTVLKQYSKQQQQTKVQQPLPPKLPNLPNGIDNLPQAPKVPEELKNATHSVGIHRIPPAIPGKSNNNNNQNKVSIQNQNQNLISTSGYQSQLPSLPINNHQNQNPSKYLQNNHHHNDQNNNYNRLESINEHHYDDIHNQEPDGKAHLGLNLNGFSHQDSLKNLPPPVGVKNDHLVTPVSNKFPSPPEEISVNQMMANGTDNNNNNGNNNFPSWPAGLENELNPAPLENKFADLTLTRPKKNKSAYSNNHRNNYSNNVSRQMNKTKMPPPTGLPNHMQNSNNFPAPSRVNNNHHLNLLHQDQDTKSISSSVPSIPEDTSQGSNEINARSNLLAEIRKGKELRKVQQQEKDRFLLEAAVDESKARGPGGINVADILNTRRMFLKDSSDEETTELSEDDWNDENVR